LVGDVLLSSLAVFLKREDMGRMEEIVGVKETYRQGIKVMSLRNVQSLALILLTRHVAFSPAESLTQLKLLEKGVPKTFLASMNAVIAPLNIMMPMISAKWTAGAKPLRVVLNTFVYRGIACAFASVVVVAWTKVLASDGAQGTAGELRKSVLERVLFRIGFSVDVRLERVIDGAVCWSHVLLFQSFRREHRWNVHDAFEHVI
jgi:hypothetical protein